MTITAKSTTDEAPANWPAMWLREVRYGRRLRLHVQLAREQRRALRAALAEAVTMIGTLSRQLDRTRENSAARAEDNRRLSAENRRLQAENAGLRREVKTTLHLPMAHTTVHGAIQ